MKPLVSDFMKPEISPTKDYSSYENTFLYRISEDSEVALEMIQRNAATYSFRYRAWVGWRDAGDIAVWFVRLADFKEDFERLEPLLKERYPCEIKPDM